MDYSRRISQIQPSPTLALNTKANQLKKLGHNILNFSIGEPDYPTPQVVVDQAIASLKAGRTKYTPAGGGPELRQAIVNKLKRDNQLNFPADQIVVGCGAKEILFHIFLALLNEGDEVILTAPCWVSYADQIKAAGAVPIIVPLPENRSICIADIEKHVTPRTKIFVLNTPNNPAGYVLTEAQTQELGIYLKSKKWWIVSDEIYEYMAYDTAHICLLQRFPELGERFILVNGMSKGFAMTGWRVGYMAGPKKVAEIVKSLQSHSSTCIPGFIEDAAVVALNGGEALCARDVQVLKDRRELALTTMKNLGGFKFIRPQGAYYIFIDVRDHLTGSLDSSLKLSEYLVEEHHIAMAPGEAFGSPGWLRLSFAVSNQTIVDGLTRLHKALFSLRS